MSVLAIGPHPDDVEYGALGYLLKLRAAHEVHIYVASLGSASDPTASEVREHESRMAFELLHPATYTVRRAFGIRLDNYEEIETSIRQIVLDRKPGLILIPGPHDTHQEHRYLYEIALTACRRTPTSILRYGIISNSTAFSPNVFVDVADVYEQKKEAIRCHHSQADKSYMTDEAIDAFHTHAAAMLCGLRYSEAYELERWFSTSPRPEVLK